MSLEKQNVINGLKVKKNKKKKFKWWERQKFHIFEIPVVSHTCIWFSYQRKKMASKWNIWFVLQNLKYNEWIIIVELFEVGKITWGQPMALSGGAGRCRVAGATVVNRTSSELPTWRRCCQSRLLHTHSTLGESSGVWGCGTGPTLNPDKDPDK